MAPISTVRDAEEDHADMQAVLLDVAESATRGRASAGRSTIYRCADGNWRCEVSLGSEPATGRRLRRKVQS